MKVNKAQMEASAHENGNALVIAGPGTGKTRTLVSRYSHLVRTGVKKPSIMVVTFTTKAADEIKLRLTQSLPSTSEKSLNRCHIGTFHSVCGRILKKFSNSAGLQKNFRILDTAAQREFLTELGLNWNSDNGDLGDIISGWKDLLISPEAALKDAREKQNQDLVAAAQHYAVYEEKMKESGHCDFADLIRKTIEIYLKDPDVRNWMARTFQHLLIDEYQDVNPLQMKFIRLCEKSGIDIWAVADDDQSLYGWRGSDVRYTLHFRKIFADSALYKLDINYRCAPPILLAAGQLIRHNRNRIKKEIKASRPAIKGEAVVVRSFENEAKEAAWIASKIAELTKSGVSHDDIAILFRTSTLTPSLQNSLSAKGIPIVLSGAQNFWALPEVRTLVATMRGLHAPGNKSYLAEIGSGRRASALMALVSSMKGCELHECAMPISRIISDHPPAGISPDRRSLWMDAAEQAAVEALKHETFERFLKHADTMEKNDPTEAESGVVLSTIHSSKGLEWKVVFVCGCEERMLPHHKSVDREEERRLFYVALTRAKSLAICTYSLSRLSKGQRPSPFLFEMAAGNEDKGVYWLNKPETAERTDGKGRKLPSGRNHEEQSHERAARPRTGGQKQRSFTVYKKGGRRSLIPPDEQD